MHSSNAFALISDGKKIFLGIGNDHWLLIEDFFVSEYNLGYSFGDWVDVSLGLRGSRVSVSDDNPSDVRFVMDMSVLDILKAAKKKLKGRI